MRKSAGTKRPQTKPTEATSNRHGHYSVIEAKLPTETDLEEIAVHINAAYSEIQDCRKKIFDCGIVALKRARACGGWLTQVKKQVRPHFKVWCSKNLEFKIRTAQNYMRVFRKLTEEDIDKLSLESLRQGLAYAGFLDNATKLKGSQVKSDPLAQVRKTVKKLVLELQACQNCDREELLAALEPVIQHTHELSHGLSGTPLPVAEDIASTVSREESSATTEAQPKAQRVALLPATTSANAKLKTISFRLTDAMDSKLQEMCSQPHGPDVSSPSDLMRKVVLDYLQGSLLYTNPKYEETCSEVLDSNTNPAKTGPDPIREKVVSFRVLDETYTLLQERLRVRPRLGVRSLQQLARTLVQDFLDGRLCYSHAATGT